MDIKDIQEQAYQRGLADGRSRALLEQEFKHGMAAFCDVSCIRIISCEDSSVHYLGFPDGLRLISQDGKYVGWYACDGHEAPDFKQREKLVERIEKGCICPNDANPFYCDTECQYNDSLCCGNERLADYLIANGVTVQSDELPTNCNQLWIPVTERLPEEYVSVLGYMTDAGEFPPVRECYAVGNAFFFPALFDIHPVSHWMPMPVPPKEE